MTTFLFMISFLLHVLTLAAIYYLLQQVKAVKNNNSKEIIELMETYVQEIKDENIRLQSLIHSSNGQKSSVFTQPVIEKELKDDAVMEQRNDRYTPPMENKGEDHVEASLEAKVLQLYTQGYSITEIAKKLNCGKTEAELIIQLHKKNTK